MEPLHNHNLQGVMTSSSVPENKSETIESALNLFQNLQAGRSQPVGRLLAGLESFLGLDFAKTPCLFDLHLDPNEPYPESVKEHLDLMEAGWLVSTGTERSLFDLLAAPTRCIGVLIRDINWKVKAYIDCIVLLLRICDTPEEFKGLTEGEERIDRIRERLEQTPTIPPDIKQYYLANLKDLVEVYFSCSRRWYRDSDVNYLFKNVNYLENREQYDKLMSYARNGKIIATVGDMNDLEFLQKHNIRISAVDISNIADYTNLDIPLNTRVIYTVGTGLEADGGTSWYSYKHEPLNEVEKGACLKSLELIRLASRWQRSSLPKNNFIDYRDVIKELICWEYMQQKKPTDSTARAMFECLSKQIFPEIIDYQERYIFQVSPGIYANLDDESDVSSLLTSFDPEAFEDLNPQITSLYPKLVVTGGVGWKVFAKLEGWRSAFEDRYRKPEHRKEFQDIVKFISEQMIEDFGKERFDRIG